MSMSEMKVNIKITYGHVSAKYDVYFRNSEFINYLLEKGQLSALLLSHNVNT